MYLIFFFISTFFMIFLNNLKLIFYSPLLAISLFKQNFLFCIWLAILSGFTTDLFSSFPFGLHILSYTLAMFILYHLKRFFKENIINTTIVSILISIFYTLFFISFLFIFERSLKISFNWIITDLIIMPFFDGIYTLFLFLIPLSFLQFLKKRMLFLRKR
ncbi:MAG: hypothetical protein AMS24_01380 [Chlamydiae bacterium SM23_39]|nr:MAG: hypothetical protein AMS24_01380 [Chlamydiae bacterium SM23_39]